MIRAEIQGKVDLKKLSRSGLGAVPSHKRARVYNNFKSEDLILKQRF